MRSISSSPPSSRHTLTLEPSGRTAAVPHGTWLVDALVSAGVVPDLPCGGEGTCGKCRVHCTDGAPQPTAEERAAIDAAELARGIRLACRHHLDGDLTVSVAEATSPGTAPILSRFAEAPATTVQPAVEKRYAELAPPTRGDERADLVRLEEALGPLDVDLDLLAALPGALRAAAFRGTAVLDGRRLVDFEAGDTRATHLAAALDVGTTTLAGTLLDAGTGRVLALATRLNPQTRFGDDVLSRIQFAAQDAASLARIQRVLLDDLNEMLTEMARAAAAPLRRIYTVTLAGNTTMEQLLLGLDPRYLGEVPFVPAAGRPVRTTAAALGLPVHPRAAVFVFPVIGGFVGGDVVGGLLATGLAERREPALLIDVGTNGEIVLAAGGRLTAAATAAGPAFEGARIRHGMRAAAGAIEQIAVDAGGDLVRETIGNAPARGLCGSALVDLAALLLRHGIVGPEGKLRAAEELAFAPPPLARRLVVAEGQPAFLVAEAAETADGRAILLTQRDVRELQLAAGAIRAGVQILLRRAGRTAGELGEVLVAGGFGNYIRRRSALRIGLLPPEIDPERIRFVGNAALAGARLAALSLAHQQAAAALAAACEHLDLATDPRFEVTFAEAMRFPDGPTHITEK